MIGIDLPTLIAKAQMEPGWGSGGLGTGPQMLGGQIFPGHPAAQEFDYREVGPQGTDLVAGAGMPLGLMAAKLKFISNDAKQFQQTWNNLKDKAEYKSIRGDKLAFIHKSTKNPNSWQATIFDNAGLIGDKQISMDEDIYLAMKKIGYLPKDYQKIKVTGGLGKPSANYGGFGWEPISPNITKLWHGPKEYVDWMKTRLESGGYNVEVIDIPIVDRIKIKNE